MYKIKKRTRDRARKMGVTVKPSSRKGKKIDVIRNGKKLASIGAIGYDDYPTFLQLEKKGIVPPGTAARRKRAYKKRHASNRKRTGTPGWYADKLLWT